MHTRSRAGLCLAAGENAGSQLACTADGVDAILHIAL